MARYEPPKQGGFMQLIDIIFVVGAIALALWLPLKLEWAVAAKEITAVANPTWELLGQTPAQAAAWEALGKTPADAHDLIQSRFNYTINWLELILMAAALLGYFVFLFRASDKEYREVIAEKFGDKK